MKKKKTNYFEGESEFNYARYSKTLTKLENEQQIGDELMRVLELHPIHQHDDFGEQAECPQCKAIACYRRSRKK